MQFTSVWVYPKTFKFVGWHPFCRCIAVPKLADEDEFIARRQALIDGEAAPQGGYSGEVTEIPECFTEWVQANAKRIETAKNQPYFIQDNRAEVDKALRREGSHANDSKSAEEVARIEVNRREYERLKADQNYKDVEFNPDNGGLKATHVKHNFDGRTGWYEKSVQEVGFNFGNSIILEEEIHSIQNKKNVEGMFNSLPFEIAGAETGTPNNIRNALKHCASKPNCKVAVVFYPDETKIDMKCIREGLKKYYGLRNDPKQFKDFQEIYIMTSTKIIYVQKKQGD